MVTALSASFGARKTSPCFCVRQHFVRTSTKAESSQRSKGGKHFQLYSVVITVLKWVVSRGT